MIREKLIELDYSCLLAGRLIGIGNEKEKIYHAAMGIPPPPSSYIYHKVQNELPIAVKVAYESMARAKEELEKRIGIDHITNYINFPVSYDGANSKPKSIISSKYYFTFAISTKTGKEIAYNNIACNKRIQPEIQLSQIIQEHSSGLA